LQYRLRYHRIWNPRTMSFRTPLFVLASLGGLRLRGTGRWQFLFALRYK
jgi:hypothetical protein